eukprot:12798332-Alexandrium_andersonii.AAC.1
MPLLESFSEVLSGNEPSTRHAQVHVRHCQNTANIAHRPTDTHEEDPTHLLGLLRKGCEGTDRSARVL